MIPGLKYRAEAKPGKKIKITKQQNDMMNRIKIEPFVFFFSFRACEFLFRLVKFMEVHALRACVQFKFL
jgi:hypothetical protein